MDKAKRVLRSMYNWVQQAHILTPAEKNAYSNLLIALGHDLNANKPGTIDEIIKLGNHLIDGKLRKIKTIFGAEITKIER